MRPQAKGTTPNANPTKPRCRKTTSGRTPPTSAGTFAGSLRPNLAPDKLLLTKRELADALSISMSSVDRWSAAGWLPRPIRVGAAIRWAKADVEAVIQQLRGNGPKADNRKPADATA